jgi:signal transduction histidine kinase
MGNALSPKPVDLNAIISDVQKIFNTVFGERITLETRLDPKLGLVRGDGRAMEALLMNVFIRARDASAVGSELVVATSNLDLDSSAAAGMNVAPGRYARLQFAVDRDLDLGSIRALIEQLHGAIQIQSSPQQRITVTIALPRA